LTLGRAELVSPAVVDVSALAVASGLAASSRHPLSRAIVAVAAARNVEAADLADVVEHPGQGLEGRLGHTHVKLGSRAWCDATDDPDDATGLDGRLELFLRIGNGRPQAFRFEDTPRRDAVSVLSELARRGLDLEILSGDRPGAVEHMARLLGVARHRSETDPNEKVLHVRNLSLEGRRVLVVGDGVNDAPALAAGFTSMAPSSAADAGRTAADFVFFSEALAPVALAHKIAHRARRLVLQNFALAAGYNVIAVPLAVLGYASPLVAAIAMSSSSIIVCANAMRLRLEAGRPGPRHRDDAGAASRHPADDRAHKDAA
jgi:Cu2+-exporting ATPase